MLHLRGLRAATTIGLLALAPRLARAQDGPGVSESQGLQSQPNSPPPPSAYSLRRTLETETQFRLGYSYMLRRQGTDAAPYIGMSIPVSGAEGYWGERWLTFGFHGSIAPVIFVPQAPASGGGTSGRDTIVMPRYRVGVYATFQLHPLLHLRDVDLGLTLGFSGGAVGGIGEAIQMYYVDVPLRLSVGFHVESRLRVGPYVEYTQYVPVACSHPMGVTCSPQLSEELEFGVALTFTVPAPMPPLPRP